MTSIHTFMAQQGLVRTREGRLLAGVCSGLGRRVGLDPWPARILFLLLLLVIPGSQLLVYPVLWILMPEEGYTPVRPPAAQPWTTGPAGRPDDERPA